jgi:hypothetical protein
VLFVAYDSRSNSHLFPQKSINRLEYESCKVEI